jgi:endonuclease YncB( thermonuclease family)
VANVADGDTITILDSKRQQHRIRLAGIDAPEKNQPFSAASKKHLSEIAAGNEATNHCYKRDHYQHLICIVYINGEDVALAQLDAVLAWVYRQYVGELSLGVRHEYEMAEGRASANKVGLWRDSNPMPPWEWRRGGTTASTPDTCAIKGNINRKGDRIHHVPGSRWYRATKIDESRGERWFCTEDEAVAAGRRAPRR